MRPLGDTSLSLQESRGRRVPTRSRTNSFAVSAPSGDVSAGCVFIHGDNSEVDSAEVTEETVPPPLTAVTRTKKAKETQRKLGVGRPATAGGSGARVSTKKAVSRGIYNGSKSYKIASLLQDTIEEEGESGLLHTYLNLIKLKRIYF